MSTLLQWESPAPIGADSQVDVLITDGILNVATGAAKVLDSQSLYPKLSFRPQTVEFGTSLDLMPSVIYYIVLNGRAANAETNPGQFPVTQGPGFLKDSYYVTSGLGLNPIQATWTLLTFSTVSFEFIGTTVPEPELGPLVGILLLIAFAKCSAARYQRKNSSSSNL